MSGISRVGVLIQRNTRSSSKARRPPSFFRLGGKADRSRQETASWIRSGCSSSALTEAKNQRTVARGDANRGSTAAALWGCSVFSFVGGSAAVAGLSAEGFSAAGSLGTAAGSRAKPSAPLDQQTVQAKSNRVSRWPACKIRGVMRFEMPRGFERPGGTFPAALSAQCKGATLKFRL